MRFYPDIPSRRARAIAGDIVVVLLVVFFAWCGVRVHGAVDDLSSLGRGVQDAGTSVQTSFANAGPLVGNIPIVGGSLKSSLQQAGQATGGNVVKAGQDGEDAVHTAARWLGWVTFVLPTIVLLLWAIPRRVDRTRRVLEARRALAAPLTPERERLLARRAAFGLPLSALLPYTPDPIEDLQDGRYAPLLRALYEDAGLRAPAAGGGGAPGTAVIA